MTSTWPTCGTCGQPVPAAPVERCECGHPKTEHHVTEKTRNVTYCCRIEGRSQCPCKAYADARSAA